MRIIDIRKFNRGYAVYVNMDYDIKLLDKDKRFSLLTIYSKNNKLLGKEYFFGEEKTLSCKEMQKWVRVTVLGNVSTLKIVKPVDTFDAPSESFLERGIVKTHKKHFVFRGKQEKRNNRKI